MYLFVSYPIDKQADPAPAFESVAYVLIQEIGLSLSICSGHIP